MVDVMGTLQDGARPLKDSSITEHAFRSKDGKFIQRNGRIIPLHIHIHIHGSFIHPCMMLSRSSDALVT